MANKYTSNIKKTEQDKGGAYSYSSSKSKGASYDKDLSATKKSNSVDSGGLTANRDEKRGRPKADAPRGKRKTTKKGRK